MGGQSGPVQGQQQYTSAGTYSFVVPAGVTSISAVVVGGGGGGFSPNDGGGGSGAALAYVNNISVTAGETLTVNSGAPGPAGTSNGEGGESNILRGATKLVAAQGGGWAYGSSRGGGGVVLVGTGGQGGAGSGSSGGGAGGYSGQGGGGGGGGGGTGITGAGGGGGGGGERADGFISGDYDYQFGGSGGGGVGLLGQGANGTGGLKGNGGQGGSSGGGGGNSSTSGGPGGAYGGGGGMGGYVYNIPAEDYVSWSTGAAGSVGAVRIIWPGNTRQFPSTNTGNV